MSRAQQGFRLLARQLGNVRDELDGQAEASTDRANRDVRRDRNGPGAELLVSRNVRKATAETGGIACGKELLRVVPGASLPPMALGRLTARSSVPSLLVTRPTRPLVAVTAAVYRRFSRIFGLLVTVASPSWVDSIGWD